MKDRLYLKILFIIIFIFFLPHLIYPGLLSTRDNDLGRNYIPIFSFIQKSLLRYHQFPLWRPDQLMGESFIANPVYSPIYPANLIFLILPVKLGSIVYYLFHFLIAAFSTYYLAKSYSFSPKASFTAALFYSLSTKMLVHLEAGHITMVAAFSLFPLVFLSIRLLIFKYRPLWLAAAATSFALTYFAYPTIFYYIFIFISLYLIYVLIFIFKFRPNNAIRPILLFFTVTILAILIMAIELLPHLEFAPLSSRSQLRLEDVALPLWNIKKFAINLLFPYLEKKLNHEAFLYFGLIPTILTVIGFFSLTKIKKAIFICTSVFMLFYVAGLSTPVFPFFYNYLPLLNYSRITTRPWFIMALLVSFLSAFAIERIKNKTIFYFIIGLFLIETLFIFYSRLSEIPRLNFSNDAIYRFLEKDKDLFRVYCTTGCFNPQQLSDYGIQTLSGESPIQQASFINFLQKAGNYTYDKFAVIFPPYQVWQTANPPIPNASLLGEANVKYVASTYRIQDANYKFIEQFENIFLYENTQFKQRFYFENSPDPIKIARNSPNEINLKFDRQNTAKTIVISQNYYPGWIASIINQKFKVETQNQVFKKVIIPSDTEDVWLKFQPKSYILGRTITLGTLAFLLLYLLKKRKINEKNSNN